MLLIFFVFLFVLLDVAALLWGVDSREQIDSPEWQKHAKFWSTHSVTL